jgi:DNA helicase II / ATP-dependent DNA helicase PcrA
MSRRCRSCARPSATTPQLDGCSLLEGLEAYQELLDEQELPRLLVDPRRGRRSADQQRRSSRERLAERVKYVIVDEYQDVNPIQEAIVWSLHELGAQICVVGDDDQTIYQWRGSDVGNILTFEKRYPASTQIPLGGELPLERRHRRDGARLHRAEPGATAKEMKPTGAQPYEPGDIVALSFD